MSDSGVNQTYPERNDLEIGSRWYSVGRGPEREAIILGLRVGKVPKGRRFRIFVEVDHDRMGRIEIDADKFVNEWYHWR